MTTFCIQIQPTRAPDLDMDRVRSLCRLVSSRRALAEYHSIVSSDENQHLNLIFETGQPQEFWGLLQSVFYEDIKVGPDLARASLALCEGDQGWDDCLVLHHFDPKVETDTL